MRNLLDTSKCSKFDPTFDNRECSHYQYPEDSKMNIIDGQCGMCKLPDNYQCEPDITRTIPLSHSSSGDWCICHFLCYLRKIRGIEVKPQFLSNAIKAGQLWDTCLQKYLGGDASPAKVIEKYEIPDMVVAKVRAVYDAYKELEIQVDEGYELQAKIDVELEVSLPECSFIPNIRVGKEDVNLWALRDQQQESGRSWKFPLYVNGFYDRKYPTYFAENKLSGRPENYLDPRYIQSQNGTYFLTDPNLEYCIMEVVRFPQLKELKATKSRGEETPDQMYQRCYDDILSRPSYYFLGLNKQTHRYGKRFYRGEFDLKEIETRYQQIVMEMKMAQWSGCWYKNWKACGQVFPGIPCEYQTVCSTGNISDEMFTIRGK